MGKGVVNRANAAYVKVINVTDNPITLTSGRILAQCQSVTLPSNKKVKKIVKLNVHSAVIPDYLKDLFDRSKFNLNLSKKEKLEDVLSSLKIRLLRMTMIGSHWFGQPHYQYR